MLDISVQIVNYRTKKYTDTCISDVLDDLRGANFSFRVLVLDNNSGDDFSDLKLKYKNQQVDFFDSEENRGFGAGHNRLSKEVTSKYILILNPDIQIIEANTISRLLAAVQGDIKVVGPKLLTAERKPQIWDHGEWEGIFGWIAKNAGASYWACRKSPRLVGWVCGAFFLIERMTFEEVGGFDEHFFLYKEEEDLCLQVAERGGKVLYDPNVNVVHIGSVVAGKDSGGHFRNSRDYFSKKHYSRNILAGIYSFIYRTLLDK